MIEKIKNIDYHDLSPNGLKELIKILDEYNYQLDFKGAFEKLNQYIVDNLYLYDDGLEELLNKIKKEYNLEGE